MKPKRETETHGQGAARTRMMECEKVTVADKCLCMCACTRRGSGLSQSPIVQEHLAIAAVAPECQSFGGGFGATSINGVGCSYHILPDRLYFYPSVRAEAGAAAKCQRVAALLREAVHGVHALLSDTQT